MPISFPNPRTIGYSHFGQGTPKRVSVTGGSTQLLAANAERIYAQFINRGSVPIWIGLGEDAVVGQQTRILPGVTYSLMNNELYLGEINAIAESGTVNTDVIEGI